jgi:L-aminoadipate-semialdehyde dehydrogenase
MKNPWLIELGIQANNSGANDGSDWWSDQQAAGEITSVNPALDEPIAQVYRCSPADRERIIQNSTAAFNQWRTVPAPKRGELIRQIGEALRAKKSQLGRLISLETGKSAAEGLGEVQEMIDMADFAVGQSRMLYGKTMHSERLEHRMYEQWHPLGVVGVITAFNFPMAVWSWNAFLAAVAGNTVIWKPSSKTPLCAIAVQKICHQVMVNQGYSGIFSLLVTDDRQQMAAFVDDTRLPLISFTGSTKVGRQVNQQVAGRLGRCLLELGGNNAIIIDESADLDLVIPSVVFGAIGTAGQRCTSTRRLIIQEAIYEKVLGKLIHAYRQITIGDPLDSKNIMGPLIDRAAVNQYRKALQEIAASGGSILHGGKVLDRPGFFVEPVLVRAENHWEIVQQETFAPILYLIIYQTLENAIHLQNAVPQGLSSALFTSRLQHAEYFLSTAGSDCGIANINIGTSGAEIGGAFGGEKATGGGREAGSDCWKTYMRRQTNTINWGHTLPLAQGIRFSSFD